MKFETARIHFLSDVFGLLLSWNFATMATWRNDFSSLLSRLLEIGRIWFAWHSLRNSRVLVCFSFFFR